MNQNSILTPGSHQSDPKKTVKLPPEGKQVAKTGEFTRARIFLFISLPILILLFNTNTIIVSIITTMLILLSIGTLFDPISHGMLKHLDTLLVFLSKPFAWLWHFFFVKHRASFGRRLKQHRRLIIDTIAIISIVILLGATTLRPFVTSTIGHLNDSVCLSTNLPWTACDSGFGVTTLSDGIDVRIGLIADNTYGPFDQTEYNQDETKVENLIFAEDHHACAGQHITLVIATILSRTIEDPERSAALGLEDLQGSYLAQHAFNATRPAVSICLVIANLGTADTAISTSSLYQRHPDDYSLPQIIHQLAQLARTDPSFRGIVGFPYSEQVTEALYLIKNEYPNLAAIPIISPSASSDTFSNTPNFYRIVSPDQSQGKVLAQFFCENLLPSQSSDSMAMFTDNSDTYSNSLYGAFNDALACGNATDRTTISYTNGDAATIRKAVDQAVEQHATYIFFPGYEQDMDTVQDEIHQKLQGLANQVTIIAGDAINNVSSTTRYSYSRVYATSFTAPLPQTTPMVTEFIQQNFSKPLIEGSSRLWLPTDTLLTYDALNAFTQPLEILQSGFNQSDFNAALAHITFYGVSGEIDFQGDRKNGHSSDRERGYVYITCNDYIHTNHLLAGYSIANNDNGSPMNLHLSSASGVSSCS
jgi:ABC-type branched-subunit amino acid transport system substrate-binding protein